MDHHVTKCIIVVDYNFLICILCTLMQKEKDKKTNFPKNNHFSIGTSISDLMNFAFEIQKIIFFSYVYEFRYSVFRNQNLTDCWKYSNLFLEKKYVQFCLSYFSKWCIGKIAMLFPYDSVDIFFLYYRKAQHIQCV